MDTLCGVSPPGSPVHFSLRRARCLAHDDPCPEPHPCPEQLLSYLAQHGAAQLYAVGSVAVASCSSVPSEFHADAARCLSPSSFPYPPDLVPSGWCPAANVVTTPESRIVVGIARP